MLEVASYHRAHSVHVQCGHVNGEHHERHERDVLVVIVADPIELRKQAEVPLLYEGDEPLAGPGEVDGAQQVVKDLGSRGAFGDVH